MADEITLDRLHSLARERGVSFAEVVREALADKATEFRPKPRSIGIANSGGSSIARNEAAEPVPPRSWR